jgi:hypothetical protein
MKCGHCKGNHDTVDAVRLCSTGFSGVTVTTTTSTRDRSRITVGEGLYGLDDKVYQVVKSRASGFLYAKVLVPPTVEGDRGTWELAKGFVYRLEPEDLMTAEKAAEFGSLYGVCCNCGMPLTREESKRRCYGPTCADNKGWPYDHNAH